MKVKDVMTDDVLTVKTSATLKETAQLLADLGISGMPVVDDKNVLVGVISEADILYKERGPERRHGGSFAWLFFPELLDTSKLDARTAGEAMSRPAVTIRPNRPVNEAAGLMLDEAVNRLPVVDAEGKLLGIVTRADLVRAFTRTDAEIEEEIRKELVSGTLWLEPTEVAIRVERGEVTIEGQVDTKSDADLLPELIREVPGVISVDAKLLTWKVPAHSR